MRITLLPAALSAALLSITCLTHPVSAQSSPGAISFTWGEEYELPRRHQDLGFLGNATDGYMQIGHREHSSLSFQKFSPNLHLASEKEVDLSELPKDYSNEWLTQIGNKYYWFFSTYDKGEGKERLFSQELDLATGGMQSSATEILGTSKLGGTLTMTGFYRYALKDKWNFFTSFDRSKILVQYRKKPERRDDSKNNDVIGYYVFDAQMKKLWGREIRMPYTEEVMDNEDYQVDSRGNVYTLAKIYEGRARDRKHPNYHFEILKWSADKTEVTKIPFRFTDRFVKAALITETPDGQIMVTGYYSSKKLGSADGAFLLKLDENTNELNNVMKGTYEFPASVLKQYESRRTQRRIERKNEDDNAEAQNLMFSKAVINADGSIELYGEEHYIVEIQHYRNGVYSGSTYKYYYDDILAMKIGADGNLKWMQKIPKQQAGGAGIGGMSFKQYSHKGDSYMLFMDNKKNLDIQPDEVPATHVDGKGGILMAVKIDDSGNMTKAQVFDVREEKVNLTVTDFDEVGNNQLIVRGRARHKENKAALITFN